MDKMIGVYCALHDVLKYMYIVEWLTLANSQIYYLYFIFLKAFNIHSFHTSRILYVVIKHVIKPTSTTVLFSYSLVLMQQFKGKTER